MIAAAMGADGDLVEKRLARRCRCFAVWIEDSLAGEFARESRESHVSNARIARESRESGLSGVQLLAGYGWLSTGPEWIGEVQVEIKPGAREGYIWNCVTMPGHRRKGVFRSLVAGISAAAGRSGLRRVWIGSVAIPAEKALGPLGFRPALRFDSTHLAGLHVMRITRGPEPALASDASSALALKPGVLVRAARRRRH